MSLHIDCDRVKHRAVSVSSHIASILENRKPTPLPLFCRQYPKAPAVYHADPEYHPTTPSLSSKLHPMRLAPMAQQLIVAQKAIGSSESTPWYRARMPNRVDLVFLSVASQVRWTAKSAAAVGMSADDASWAHLDCLGCLGWRSGRVITPDGGG